MVEVRNESPVGARAGLWQNITSREAVKKVGVPRNPMDWVERVKRFARQQNPIFAGAVDIVPWTLYDRISLSNGATSARKYSFFITPQGQSSKTKVDTNMERAGELPNPQVFNAMGIGFYPASTALKADIDEILEDYYVEFRIGDSKIYAEGKPSQFPGGAGLDAFTTRNTDSAYKIGEPNFANCWDLRLPPGMPLTDAKGNPFMTDGITGQVILQGQSFRVDLVSDNTFTVGSNPFTLYCFLYGILSRGVY